MPYRQLVPYTHKIRPFHVDKAIDAEMTRLEIDLQQADIDLAAFQDTKQLATFIRHYQVDNGFDEFDEL